MRAGRLLTMLSILQRQGRTTARELAARLEVTPRTVLRDVGALSEAGVPIFTVQGANGGIELVDGFRTQLGALTAEAAAGLLLAGSRPVAQALGLGAHAAAARLALVEALPPGLFAEAVDVETWFLHEPQVAPAVPRDVTITLATALRAGLRAVLRGPDGDEPVVPLGLVLSGGSWFLVHLSPGGPAVRPLAGVLGADVVQRPVPRHPRADLAATWVALGGDRGHIPSAGRVEPGKRSG